MKPSVESIPGDKIVWRTLFMIETDTQMVGPHLKILWHGEDNSAGNSERSKRERKTEEEMGR